MSLPLQAWVKKKEQSMEWKYTDFPLRENILAQWPVKKVMLSVWEDSPVLISWNKM